MFSGLNTSVLINESIFGNELPTEHKHTCDLWESFAPPKKRFKLSTAEIKPSIFSIILQPATIIFNTQSFTGQDIVACDWFKTDDSDQSQKCDFLCHFVGNLDLTIPIISNESNSVKIQIFVRLASGETSCLDMEQNDTIHGSLHSVSSPMGSQVFSE